MHKNHSSHNIGVIAYSQVNPGLNDKRWSGVQITARVT